MAPPSGTLRVGRYFLALLALIAVLYLVVFYPGNRHKPKLGIDLAGGQRVEFKAQVPKGFPQPSSGQMDQARQIIEDRVNSKGVTGATVVVQGTNQLIVEIPSATGADIAQLGQASILNFRGLLTPIVPVSCGMPTVAPSVSTSGSSSPSATGTGGTSGSPTPGSSTGSAPAANNTSKTPTGGATGSAKAPADARHQPLQAPATPTSTATKPTATTPTGSATAPTGSATAPSSTTGTGTGSGAATGSGATPSTGSTSPSSVTTKCSSDPFASVVKTYPSLKSLLEPSLATKQVGLNAESCPSQALPKLDGKTVACHAYASLTAAQQSAITVALTNYDCNAAQNEADVAYNAYVACGDLGGGTMGAYLLGHVVVAGSDISSATSVAPSSGQTTTTQYSVNLTLSNTGGDKWQAWTSKFNTNGQTANQPIETGTGTPACSSAASMPCSDYVGFTLNGKVISSPVTEAVLSTQTNISGSFSQSQANSLAQQLNYGKLPISFSLQQSDTVSATLGSTQLSAAFLAGGIGLLLVVIYSLLYYRGLGLVTIASLLVSAIFTYAMLVILGSQIGFTLDLAGIAGFIVALGITADSFVVFFERIKDEVHEGRSIRVAVPRAWVRARRTILSADTVSFLAAAILYFFASADVKGFAFTLGLSTILDLVVVFLFTHPIVSLLSRSRTFGSPRFTGLNALRGTPIADEEPAPSRRKPARALGKGRPTGRAGSLAVAESDTDERSDHDDPGAEDTEAAGRSAADSDEPTIEPTTQTKPRTPQAGGTAAERAAARRARLREESGDSDSEGGQ